MFFFLKIVFEDKALADQAVHAVEKAVGANHESATGEKSEATGVRKEV